MRTQEQIDELDGLKALSTELEEVQIELALLIERLNRLVRGHEEVFNTVRLEEITKKLEALLGSRKTYDPNILAEFLKVENLYDSLLNADEE